MNVDIMNIPEEEPIAKPRQVQIALYLLYAYLVLSVIGSFASGYQLSQLTDNYSLENQLISLVISSSIYLFLIYKISKGKTWPRLLLLYWFLYIIYSSYILVVSTPLKVFIVMNCLLGVVAIVLLYLKPSKAWFESFKRLDGRDSTYYSYASVKSQPTPQISHSQVLSKLRQHFPEEEDYQKAKALLDYYSNESNLPNPERVQAAIIKISGGDLEKLKVAIDTAKSDWRDALTWAEYPGQQKNAGLRGKIPPGEYQKIIDDDYQQYMDWLNSE